MSRVDVVIPCYKYAHFLGGCVESVLAQGRVDVRVLIIDDASPDNTAEVAAQLAEGDSRVEFRRHPVNQGHIATYNEGLLEWASSDYVLLLSADDKLTPGALHRAAAFLDANPDVGLVCGRQIVFETEELLPKTLPAAVPCTGKVIPGPAFLQSMCSAGANPVATPTAVVRTRLLKQVGGYRRELPHTADMELWLRLAVHSSVGVLAADQAYKRSHGKNMQAEYVASVLGDLRQRKAAFDFLFRAYGDRISGSLQMEQLALRSLAEQAFWAASSSFDRGNAQRCSELLDYAIELDPGLRFQPHWSRLRWKQRVGVRLWSWLRPRWDRWRHPMPIPDQTPYPL